MHYASRRVQDVVTYEAILEVANEELKLRPGMTAVADIVTSKVESALLIPNAALRFTPDVDSTELTFGEDKSPTSQVWIAENDSLVPHAVTTGHTDGRYTEMKDGILQDGMPLIVGMIR